MLSMLRLFSRWLLDTCLLVREPQSLALPGPRDLLPHRCRPLLPHCPLQLPPPSHPGPSANLTHCTVTRVRMAPFSSETLPSHHLCLRALIKTCPLSNTPSISSPAVSLPSGAILPTCQLRLEEEVSGPPPLKSCLGGNLNNVRNEAWLMGHNGHRRAPDC